MRAVSPAKKAGDSSTIPDFNVVILGSAGVGKSALVRRFLKNSFSDNYKPTVEETYATVLQTLNGSCVRLVLTDTAGLHPFPAMRELRMRNGNVFLLVFAFDSEDSFEEALRLFDELKRVRGDQFDPEMVIFVGNKMDILSVPFNGNERDNQLETTTTNDATLEPIDWSKAVPLENTPSDDEAGDIYVQAKSRLLGQLNARYVNTSAKFGRNVLELFHVILWPTVLASARLKCMQQRNLVEDSPVSRASTRDAAAKKVSWPWRHSSDIPTSFALHQRTTSPQSRVERKISVADLRVGRAGNVGVMDLHQRPSLFTRHCVGRKFSIGSHLFPASAHPRVNEDHLNKPASRSRSVDNSVLKNIRIYDNVSKDSVSTFSGFSERSFSSVSSVALNGIGVDNNRPASACSEAFYLPGKAKYGNYLSPSPNGLHSGRGSMEIFPCTLNFVKEVGQNLDPANCSPSCEQRIPQAPLLGRQYKSSSGPAWERVKKRSVFSQPPFTVDIQISEIVEPTPSPKSEDGYFPKLVSFTLCNEDEYASSPMTLLHPSNDTAMRRNFCRIS